MADNNKKGQRKMPPRQAAPQQPPVGGSLAKQKKPDRSSIEGLLLANQRQIAAVLLKQQGLTPQRFSRIALSSVERNPRLRECTPASLFSCMLQAATVGLEVDNALGHAYLVPFRDNNRDVRICTLILGYKGLVQLMYRSGLVSYVSAQAVHASDEFDYEFGLNQSLRHVPHYEEGASTTHAYAVVRMRDGHQFFDVMSLAEIDRIRKRSRAAFDGPWVSDFDEMAKKGLALDTCLPTPSGWTTMAEVMPGDVVFDINGVQTIVTAVSEIKQLPCFRVTFADGESLICDDEHRWLARIEPNQREWKVFTVNELFAAKQRGFPVSMPVAGSLELGDSDLPIDPWLLGYWVGDGHSYNATFTTSPDDLPHFTESVEGAGMTVGAVRPDTRSVAVAVGVRSGLKTKPRDADLIANKHIPSRYLRASHGQRLNLLQGLMDSDGHVEAERGRAIFEQTDQRLAEQVCEVLASLGEKYHMSVQQRSGFETVATTYRIEWTPLNCPVSLPRKAGRWRGRTLTGYRGVAAIEEIESVPTRCIAVDSPTQTYLAGRAMIPTHNTVLRRIAKLVPLTVQDQRLLAADEMADAGKAQDDLLTIDQEFTGFADEQPAIDVPAEPEDVDPPPEYEQPDDPPPDQLGGEAGAGDAPPDDDGVPTQRSWEDMPAGDPMRDH